MKFVPLKLTPGLSLTTPRTEGYPGGGWWCGNRKPAGLRPFSGRLAQVRDAQGRVVSFGYDKNLQFTQVVGPSGERYKYAYDPQGNVTGVTDPLRQGTTFRYDATFNGRISESCKS